jgi:hypothetical protein
MPRNAAEHDAPGHDSFLDIVANMVGILIILVMLVGVRARNAPLDAAQAAAVEDPALREALAVEASLTDDVWGLAGESDRVQAELAARGLKRDVMATVAAALEHKVRTERERLGAAEQAQFDAARQLVETRRRLEQIRAEEASLDNRPSPPVVVESLPTPLSRTVDENETHFQLRGGYVVHIPLKPLVEQFKSDVRRKLDRLRSQTELTDTVGPEGGFRLRYTMERREISPEIVMATGQGGAYAELRQWQLIPVAELLGEPVDDALAEGSQFRRVVAGLHPGRTTITVWTYPDSFDDFRRLKQFLFARGFSTAGRPLPDGVLISGSPEGSKSAAQ